MRLWPVVDIERPADATGPHVEVLWPIVEVDATRSPASYAIRPLLSYDPHKSEGSFLWPLGAFRTAPPAAFRLFPIYFWQRRDHHALLPLFGAFGHDGHRYDSWLFGPGLYYRERSANGSKTDAALFPPFYWRRHHRPQSSNSTLYAALWYQHHLRVLNEVDVLNRSCTDYCLFPLVWWRDEMDRVDESTNHHRELFPLLGYHKRTVQGRPVETRLRVIWPTISIAWGPDSRWSYVLGFLVGWMREAGAVTHLHAIPFYARTPTLRTIPLLGWARWDSSSRTDGAEEDGEREWSHAARGWISWPFWYTNTHYQVRHARDHDHDPVRTIDSEHWFTLGGLLGGSIRPAGERRVHETRHYLFPLASRTVRWDTDLGFPDPLPAWQWSFLLGLSYFEHDPPRGRREASLVRWLIYHQQQPNRLRHAVAPLYTYEKTPRRTRFTSLAWLVQCRHAESVDPGLAMVFAPFQYGSTPDGDHRLRLLWKLIESDRRGTERRWGVHPLVYSRSNLEDRTLLILGGLVGYTRNADRRALRLLWGFDVPL